MRFSKNKPVAKHENRRRTVQLGVSAAADAVLDADRLSPEFFELIHDWDPEAANDEYYVTSSDFIELHSQIRKFLIRRMIMWSASVLVGMSGLIFVYQ